ncbi:hypothetical protein C5167_023359 [Papaver somniferum]|uniref:Uncharacterized protein n=1 Tax=Papaver somniferum TaxID=3469 RepID=A0A4Y7JLI9_PAPSO|nr:hypothetical protein C5167_023359 [Papaver somniferum]
MPYHSLHKTTSSILSHHQQQPPSSLSYSPDSISHQFVENHHLIHLLASNHSNNFN